MSKLSDISNANLRELLGNRSVSRTLVNLQNGTATFDGVTEPDAIMIVEIDGGLFHIADVTNKALATLAALQNPITGQDGYYVQPAGTTVYYVWVVNAAGTSYVIQGTYSGQAFTPFKSALGDGSVPDIAVKSTYAPIAIFKVVTDATHTFTPGTTNWDATGITSSAAAVSVLGVNTPAFIAGGA